MTTRPAAYPFSNLLLLAGAAASIMVAGTEDVWAIVILLFAAGLALWCVRPAVRPASIPLALLSVFCCLCLLAFLPQKYFTIPAWRNVLMNMGTIPLADSVSPQPWLGWFWWWLLAGTCFVSAALLTTPLETKALALVLHAASLFVAFYASLCIFSSQSGWRYPFHGGAVFGFLPNRNHTAALLVAGSVLSFGLMQWRLVRGDKAAAAFAALCGAPALAALLFFSVSRAGVVFLVVGLAIWAVGASRSPLIRTRILSATAVLALFLGLLFLAGGSTVRDRLAQLWSESISVRSQSAGEDLDFRQPIFRDTVSMVRDFPVSGTGLGQFRYVFPQYRRDSARAADVLHPESDWLMAAAETGIPSVLALLVLFVWFVAVCWKSRAASGGMLRWTAASAVIAAALHGVIDVPWHRVSLGWFFLALAVSCVPSSGRAARTPVLSRLFFVLGGVALVTAAVWIGRENREGRLPAPYGWSRLSGQLQTLGEQRRYEEAESAAQAAVRQFPLKYESYYWLAGHLRAFEETGPEIEAAVRAGRAVEPVLPKVAEEQANLLQPYSPDSAMESWREAIERAAAVDAREQKQGLPTAVEYIRRALVMFKDDSARQLGLAQHLRGSPLLVAGWIRNANSDAAASFLAAVGQDDEFLDSLPAAQRQQVLARWVSLPGSDRAVAFMERRHVSAQGEYWPVLARYYAEHGDLPRAVRLVASSLAIPLVAPSEGEGGLRGEMATLAAQGNTVAARRLAKGAVEDAKPDVATLSAAMAYFASENDWPSAWKAGSRLATESELGH